MTLLCEHAYNCLRALSLCVFSFRQIPGDKCSATTESKKILELLTLPCTGHEQDSGFRVHSVSLALDMKL